MQLPKRPARAPERVLFIDLAAHLLRQKPHTPFVIWGGAYPFALLLVFLWTRGGCYQREHVGLLSTYLPSHPQFLQRPQFLIAHFLKELPINHRIQQPIPILPRDVRNKPRVAFAVEPDLLRQPALDQEVG